MSPNPEIRLGVVTLVITQPDGTTRTVQSS